MNLFSPSATWVSRAKFILSGLATVLPSDSFLCPPSLSYQGSHNLGPPEDVALAILPIRTVFGLCTCWSPTLTTPCPVSIKQLEKWFFLSSTHLPPCASLSKSIHIQGCPFTLASFLHPCALDNSSQTSALGHLHVSLQC